MDDCFQVSASLGVVEDNGAKLGAVDGLLRSRDQVSTKALDNLTINGTRGVEEVMGHVVGVKHRHSHFLKHFAHGGFAGANAARKSDDVDGFTRFIGCHGISFLRLS
jgi:hypothetical protein